MHYPIRLNFYPSKKNEIYRRILKEDLRIIRIAKFGCSYNIFQPNYTLLLILSCSFKIDFVILSEVKI